CDPSAPPLFPYRTLFRSRLDDATVASTRAVPSDAAAPWAGVVGLLSGGLAAAPGIAGASSAALSTLNTLAPDLETRLPGGSVARSEEHTSGLQSLTNLVF